VPDIYRYLHAHQLTTDIKQHYQRQFVNRNICFSDHMGLIQELLVR